VTPAGPQGERPAAADPEHADQERHPEPLDPAERTDAELLAAHVAGDADAFAALVARHRDRLWAIALRTMRNPDDAADALQDAYVAAFRRAGSFRGEAAVTTWLHRVVVNACLDRVRRNKVRAADPLPTDPDRAAELGTTADALDPLEAKEQRAEVNAALARLNADQRAALVLVDMEGYSVEETARILGCAVGTVKSRCARGRARLVPLLRHLRLDDPTGGTTDRSGAGRSDTPSEVRR
jgi:RNA polymerase sigma-70 factor (ECF subfamily)